MTPAHRILLAFGALLPAAPAVAQGLLNPAGPPAPNFKTLQQVEPRIDLATMPGDVGTEHVITAPGSYYLSSNLDVTTVNGIAIRASGVTLDLMGFTIFRSSAGPATGTAITIDGGLSNLAIRNGHITGGVTYDPGAGGDQFTGPGFSGGIRAANTPDPVNLRINNIHVSGCDAYGILAINSTGQSSIVEHCSVNIAGIAGIQAGEVHHSTALQCGATAIAAAGNVSHCRAESVGSGGDGLFAGGNVSSCYAVTSGDDGIACEGNVTNSVGITTGTSTSADGIVAGRNVSNCYGSSAGDDGIDCGENVTNSTGLTTGASIGAIGIDAVHSVSFAYGNSSGGNGIESNASVLSSTGVGTAGDGINATHSVMNCYGQSTSADGIESDGVISYSRGKTFTPSATNVGIDCTTAVGSIAEGGETIVNKYLMP